MLNKFILFSSSESTAKLQLKYGFKCAKKQHVSNSMKLENKAGPHLSVHHSQQGGLHPLHRLHEVRCAGGGAPRDAGERWCWSLVGEG